MFMKTLAIIAATLMALPVFAAELTAKEEDYCQRIATMTQTFAEVRDNGAGKSEMISFLEDDEDSPYGQITRMVIDQLFTFPKKSPQEEANHFYGWCVDKLGQE